MEESRIFYLGIVKEVDATGELIDQIVNRYNLDVVNLGDEGEFDYGLDDLGEELGYVSNEDLGLGSVYAVANGKLYEVVKEISTNDFFGGGNLNFSISKEDLGEGEKLYYMCPYDSGETYMECLQGVLSEKFVI